jgi:hypothetical protein
LSTSGPSFGSVLFKLPGAEKLQLASELRLWPPSTTLPKQLLPDRLLATIELCSVTVPFVV